MAEASEHQQAEEAQARAAQQAEEAQARALQQQQLRQPQDAARAVHQPEPLTTIDSAIRGAPWHRQGAYVSPWQQQAQQQAHAFEQQAATAAALQSVYKQREGEAHLQHLLHQKQQPQPVTQQQQMMQASAQSLDEAALREELLHKKQSQEETPIQKMSPAQEAVMQAKEQLCLADMQAEQEHEQTPNQKKQRLFSPNTRMSDVNDQFDRQYELANAAVQQGIAEVEGQKQAAIQRYEEMKAAFAREEEALRQKNEELQRKQMELERQQQELKQHAENSRAALQPNVPLHLQHFGLLLPKSMPPAPKEAFLPPTCKAAAMASAARLPPPPPPPSTTSPAPTAEAASPTSATPPMEPPATPKHQPYMTPPQQFIQPGPIVGSSGLFPSFPVPPGPVPSPAHPQTS